MSRSFDLSRFRLSLGDTDWKQPRVLIRGLLGVLLLLNLVAAGFAFHLFGRSAEELERELALSQRSLLEQRTRLNRTRQIAGKVERARVEGDQFLASYMTPRRTTYSTVLAELQSAAESAGTTWREGAIAPLEPLKGSNDLSMMTITASFDGTYPDLLKFVNLLDRSPRFLIIATLQAAPQPGGKMLTVTVKVNTFVRDDTGEII